MNLSRIELLPPGGQPGALPTELKIPNCLRIVGLYLYRYKLYSKTTFKLRFVKRILFIVIFFIFFIII